MFAYYNKTEVDAFLQSKASVTHNHNFQELTTYSSELLSRIQAMGDLLTQLEVTGNGSFYSKHEINGYLANKSNLYHTHDFSSILAVDPNMVSVIIDNLVMGIVPDSDIVSGVTIGTLKLVNVSDMVISDIVNFSTTSIDVSGLSSMNGGLDIGYYNSIGTFNNLLSIASTGNASIPMCSAYNLIVRDKVDLTLSNNVTISGKVAFSSQIIGGNPDTQLIINKDSHFNSVSVEGIGIFATEFCVNSSSTAKENITDVSESINIIKNIPVYKYKYINDKTQRIGVMADEVIEPLSNDKAKVDIPSMIALALDALQKLATQNQVMVGEAYAI
jgi:hypothetical protein